jgi:small-conductance mechanosensitive channel
MFENFQAFATDHPTQYVWILTTGVAVTAALVAAIAYRIVWRIALRLAHDRIFVTTVLRSTRTAGGMTVLLLVLLIVWRAAPSDLPQLATVEHLTTLALAVSVTWLGVRWISGSSEAIIATHPLTGSDSVMARRICTQQRVIAQILKGIIVFIGFALVLMSFPAVRSLGASLLASAGVTGLIVGLAARPALSNIIAGIQIALTQPIRLGDVVVVQGKWGRIEDISGTFVVVRVWDETTLVVPLQWFLENPIENWTLTSAQITGSVSLWVDYRLPLAPVKAELERLCKEAKEWDQRVCSLTVNDATPQAMQLRALVSSVDSSRNSDLRCHVRAGLIAFIQERYGDCLPQVRNVELQLKDSETVAFG